MRLTFINADWTFHNVEMILRSVRIAIGNVECVRNFV